MTDPAPGKKPQRDEIRSDVRYTVNVGRRYYVILTFNDLQPGSTYLYRFYLILTKGRRDVMDVVRMNYPNVPGIEISAPSPDLEAKIPEILDRPFDLKSVASRGNYPEFRTLPEIGQEQTRIAFGSCRKRDAGYDGVPDQNGEVDLKGKDVLKLFGQQLRGRPTERLTYWPQFLLLLGDQIYADDVDRAVVKSAGMRQGRLPSLDAPPALLTAGNWAGTKGFQCEDFAEFAESYVHAWTDQDVRFLFANLPVFMIFDDHDITDDWNITGGWRDQALGDRDWREAITDGLIAYWMYQGWGNPLPAAGASDLRVSTLADAAKSGKDALGDLRKIISPEPGHHDYYYRIESDPPVAVLDARNDRALLRPTVPGVTVYESKDDQILGEKQWSWLEKQLQVKGPAIIATSVPLLQFPYFDILALYFGRDAVNLKVHFQEPDAPTQTKVDKTEALRRDLDLDGWNAFPKSFSRITQLVSGGGPYVFLSGDVHYSYVIFDRVSLPAGSGFKGNPLILHAVSSPLRNQWETDKNPRQSAVLADPSLVEVERVRQELLARKAAKSAPFPAMNEGIEMLRYFFPNPRPVFFAKGGQSPRSGDYTYLNNIGELYLSKDRNQAIVRWFGASTVPGVPLKLLGIFNTPIGGFVR